MSFAKIHNKVGIDWGVNTEGFEYMTREKLYKEAPDNIYTLRGLYINKKGKFGDHPVAITDNCFIDFPDYMTDEVMQIMTSEEDVNDILAGKVGFTIQEFTDKTFGRTCYGISWEDLN